MDRKRNLTGNLQIITREALASLELWNCESMFTRDELIICMSTVRAMFNILIST